MVLGVKILSVVNQLPLFMGAVGKNHAALRLSEEAGLHRLTGKITL